MDTEETKAATLTTEATEVITTPTNQEEPSQESTGSSYGQDILYFIWETFRIVIISLLIIVPVRYFLIQPFFVKGASMENTFHDGNYILIDEISYRFKDPIRGDIIVFRFPEDQTQFFIKRVIGLPGETIDVNSNIVTIFNTEHPDGLVLNEPYLSPEQVTLGTIHTKLGPTEYFVMGDNRLRSSDSRIWGVLDRPLITGRVFFRAWPFSKFGAFKKAIYE